MEFLKLSNEDLEMLERLEKGKKSETPKNFVDQLMPVCQNATRLHNKLRKSYEYTVETPYVALCRSKSNVSKNLYEKYNFIGMEVLTYDRIIPTAKGEYVLIFNYRDTPDAEYLIKYDDLPTVFGKDGKIFQIWLNDQPRLDEHRRRVLNALQNVEKKHEKIEGFGSW